MPGNNKGQNAKIYLEQLNGRKLPVDQPAALLD
jgi:hypothetical protein